MISAIAAECQSKGYFLAVSNPCFEIWLLLHFEDVPNQADARKQELAGNADGLLKSEVARHCSANRPYIDHFLPHIEPAIARAEALDTEPEPDGRPSSGPTSIDWSSNCGQSHLDVSSRPVPSHTSPLYIQNASTLQFLECTYSVFSRSSERKSQLAMA